MQASFDDGTFEMSILEKQSDSRSLEVYHLDNFFGWLVLFIWMTDTG